MLPKKFKIKKNEFYIFKKKCLKINEKSCFLRYVYLDNCKKIGIVVPKKYIKLATKRNNIKRIMYRIIADQFKNLKMGYYLFYYTNSDNIKKEDIKLQIVNLITKINKYE